MSKKSLCALALAICSLAGVSRAQTLTRLKNQPPDGAAVEFQLTDGTVMVQGGGESDWYKLAPDNTGSYVNGTWTKLASLPAGYVPDAFASAVLADGRLLIEGGEYNQGVFAFTNQGAIYDPDANTWTTVAPPTGWDFIGDAPSVVLPNGKFLLGSKFDTRLAELDPSTLQWTEVRSIGKSDFNAEEGWTLLPDGSVVTVDVKNNPNSEKYIPGQGKWFTGGSTVADLQGPPSINVVMCCGGLVYHPPGEVGPAILRPNGTVFATGATHKGASAGHTSVYTPALFSTGAGTWTAGPDFPNRDQAGDSFAVLLPSGDALVEGNTGTSYTFDGTNLTPGPSTPGALMMLPTGQVLVGGFEVYNPVGTYQSAWAPTVTSFPATVVRGDTYTISGRQFNGLSQAASFGDEFETATNYPLVRITNNGTGHVFYAKTHDHSTMGVATGKTIVSTNFDVPAAMETGQSTLVVVANGIPSQPVTITVN